MAVTLLYSQCNGWGTDSPTSHTTSSLNLGSNCGIVILFGLISGNTSAPTAISAVTDSGGGTSGTTGQVWQSLVPSTAEIAFTANGHIWGRAIGGTAVNGVTITVDWVDSSNQVFAIAVVKLDGADWNAADPWGGTVHKVVNNAGNGADSATLSAAPASGGSTLAMCMADEDSTNSKAAVWSSAHGTWTVLADGTNTVLIADRHAFSFAVRTGSTDAVIDLTDVNTGNDNYSHCIMGLVTKASGGGDATATPSAVACVVGIGAPTILTGTVVTPAAVACTVGIGAPTVTATATVTPPAVACTVGIGAPSVVTGATPAPTAVACTVGIGAPTITAGADAAPSAVAVIIGIGAPTILIVTIVAPAAVAVIVGIGAPTITSSPTVTPAAVAVIVGIGAPTPVGSVNYSYPASVDTTHRKFLDQHGDVWLMLDISSWGMCQNLTDAEIVTAMQGVADRHFTCVVATLPGLKMTGFSGWDELHNAAGASFWTGTAWQSGLGAAWSSVDKVVSEAASHGIIVALSVPIFTATQGMEEELVAGTTTTAYNVGLAIGQRYASSPNVMWHIEGESGFSATGSTGVRMDALFHGLNDGTVTPRLLVAEPYLSGNGYDMYINQQDPPNSGGYTHLLLSADSVYEYTGDAVDIFETGWDRTSTYPVWDCEPPYSGAGHYDGNANVAPSATERQQMRERNLAVLIRGGVGINWGHETWWPFGAQGLFSISGVTWQDVPTKTETYEAQYCWDLVLTYCRDLTWAPTDSFITTGTGTTDAKAASGLSGSAILAYFPDNRTIAVDTTLFAGTSNVRLRWYDPTAGTYATITNGEAQTTGRSVTLPAARGDGSRDFVLVVDEAILSPASVAVIVGIGAPTITSSPTVTPAAVACTVGIGAPTITATATITPAAVACTVGIGAPTITATATVTPAAVAVVVGIGAPTITASADVAPAAIAVIVGIGTPSIVTGGSPAPAAVAVIIGIDAPAITATATVTPAAVACVVGIDAPPVTGGTIVTPAAVAVTVGIGAPALIASGLALAAAVAVLVGIGTPTIAGTDVADPDPERVTIAQRSRVTIALVSRVIVAR